jgi:D-alanyl-D-alanine carboxypeptidase (penicillin-binding protein 5/6)
LILLALVPALVAAPARAQTITTAVPHALVMDAQSGTVLYEKGADDPVPPSSVAKLLAAELVFRDLKKGAITLDTPFYISEHAWKSAQGQTSMFARVNTSIRVEDLLRGMIVQHGNDAAIALGEGLGGSEQSFAAMMNVRAAEIGMGKSHFTDPWGGPDPAQIVTARDMATLAQFIIRTYPEYYRYFGEKEFTWSKIRQLNRNPLLMDSEFGADGLTVGNMPGHGFNLVGSAVQNGQRLIVVVLDAAKSTERAEEARRLFNWGFHGFETRTLFEAGAKVGAAKVFGGADSEAPLVSEAPIRLMTPRGSSEKLSGKIVYTGPLIAPVEAGETVARLKIYRGAMLALDVPLKTGAAVEQGPLTQRAKDAALELGLQLFHKGVSKAMHSLDRKPETASAPATAP